MWHLIMLLLTGCFKNENNTFRFQTDGRTITNNHINSWLFLNGSKNSYTEIVHHKPWWKYSVLKYNRYFPPLRGKILFKSVVTCTVNTYIYYNINKWFLPRGAGILYFKVNIISYLTKSTNISHKQQCTLDMLTTGICSAFSSSDCI